MPPELSLQLSPRLSMSNLLNPTSEEPGEPESQQQVRSSLYLETVQALTRNSVGVGCLFEHTDWIRAQILGIYENQRQPVNEHTVFNQNSSAQRYVIEPQLQLNLFRNSEGALNGSRLYFRLTNEFIDPSGEGATSYNLSAETVFWLPEERFVLRGSYTTSNVTDPETRGHGVTITPFVRIGLLDNFGLRVAPEYTYDITNEQHNLLFHLKLDATIRNNPWMGASIQTFWNADLEGSGRFLDLSGVYLWLGGVLPNNMFLEGGIWLGRSAFDGPFQFARGMALGFNIKIKYGSEPRWWT